MLLLLWPLNEAGAEPALSDAAAIQLIQVSFGSSVAVKLGEQKNQNQDKLLKILSDNGLVAIENRGGRATAVLTTEGAKTLKTDNEGTGNVIKIVRNEFMKKEANDYRVISAIFRWKWNPLRLEINLKVIGFILALTPITLRWIQNLPRTMWSTH